MKVQKQILLFLGILFSINVSCSKDSSGPKTLKLGDMAQGGVVIYILQEADPGYDPKVQHGLIVSSDDVGFGLWGCKGTAIAGADSKLIGDGSKNTTDILTGCLSANIAAKQCADYSVTDGDQTYDDWYLPSLNELKLIYENKDLITFSSVSYWSSSEAGPDYVWATNFSSGLSNTVLKDEIFRIRALRSF